jgi:tetratricopeptide (TPR) repeat protein
MILKIETIIETLFLVFNQYLISSDPNQGKFDQIIEILKTLFQFNEIRQFDQALKNVIIFIVLSGIVIFVLVLLSRLPKINTLLHFGKIEAQPKRVLWATGRLIKDVIVAFPPVFRALIIIIVISVVYNTIFKPNIQFPQAPKPEAPKPAEAPTPAPAPAPASEKPVEAPVSPLPKIIPPHIPKLELHPERVYKPPTPEKQDLISSYLRLGHAFHEEGYYDKAIEMFNEALNRDPDNEDALEGVEKAKKAQELIDRLL